MLDGQFFTGSHRLETRMQNSRLTVTTKLSLSVNNLITSAAHFDQQLACRMAKVFDFDIVEATLQECIRQSHISLHQLSTLRDMLDVALVEAQADAEKPSHLTSVDTHITASILTMCPALSVCLSMRSCVRLNRVGSLDEVWAELSSRDEAKQLDGRSVAEDGAHKRYKQHRQHIPTRIMHRLVGHADEVLHLAFSNSGDFLCTVSRDETAILWEMGGSSLITPAQVATLQLDNVGMFVAWSPNDSLLAVATSGLGNNAGILHLHRNISGYWLKVAEIHTQSTYDIYPVFHGEYFMYGCTCQRDGANPRRILSESIQDREKETAVYLNVWCTASIGAEGDFGAAPSQIALSLGGPDRLWQKNFYHFAVLSFPNNSTQGHLITVTGTNSEFNDTLAIVPVSEDSLKATGPCYFIQESGALLNLQPVQISATESGFLVSVSDDECMPKLFATS